MVMSTVASAAMRFTVRRSIISGFLLSTLYNPLWGINQ
jgi:hypothetical protein